MKAKKIWESLGFERGIDPKESLNVGIRNKRSFKTMKECAKFFLDYIDKLSEGRFNNKEDIKRAFIDMAYRNEIIQGDTEEDDDNPMHLRLNSSSITRSPLRMCKDYLDGFSTFDNKGNILSQKYPPIYIEEWGVSFDQLPNKIQYLKNFNGLVQKLLGLKKNSGGIFIK